MRHLAFAASFALSIFWNAAAQAAPAVQVSLQTICDLISPSRDFSYEELFDDSFRKTIPKEVLTGIFQEIVKSNGRCLSVAPLKPLYSFVEDSNYGFILENHKQALFTASFSDQNGKITGLRYYGTSLPLERMGAREESVAMRDGTRLRTLVFTPTGTPLARPALLERTPYLKTMGRFDLKTLTTASYFVERGYVYVLQSIRGMHGSEGEALLFNPQEASDGADTITWMTRQAFSNQRIATVGTSYDGFTAVAAGVENPKGLQLILTGAGPTDSATGTFNTRGIFSLHALDYIKYFSSSEGVPFTQTTLTEKILQLTSQELDIRKYDEIIYGVTLPEWKRWTKAWANPNDPFWSRRSLLRELPRIQVPTYYLAGTHTDGNMPDSVNNFLEVERRSPHRASHHLILGNWNHGNNTPYGDGTNLAAPIAERFDALVAHWLKDEPTPYAQEPRVLVQSHFSKKFLGADTYPLPGLKKKDLFFGSDSQLADAAPTTPAAWEYRYDPQADLSKVQSLVFPYKVKEDLFVNGPLGVRLFVHIDVPQTDILLSLEHTNAEGKVQFFSNCIFGQRVSGPGIAKIEDTHCPVFAALKKGDTLKVTISSTAYPNTARNTNNAPEHFYEAPRTATIRLLEDAAHPSRIEMPLEPNRLIEE